jgi:predicted Zn-dependent protease
MRRLFVYMLARPRRWLTALLVLLVAVLLAIQGYAWYHLRAGRAALAQHHNTAARRHLDACLRVWPNSSTAHLLAARAARRANAYDEAERHLAACESGGEQKAPEVILESALLRASRGELREFEDFLLTHARKNPALAPLVWEALAEGNARMFRIRPALLILHDWLAADPDNPRAYQLRGDLYQIISVTKAVPDYDRAVELDPENDQARWSLAVVLQEVGRFDDALQHLEILRDRNWPDRDLGTRVARSLDRVGRTAEARDILDAILREHPGDALALRVRGQLELTAEDLPAAEKWLREAVRAAPGNYASRFALVQCLRQQHKDDEARDEQKAAEKVKSRQARLGDLRSREMAQRPHDPALRCEMGVLLDSLGDSELGEWWMQSALYENPDYRPAHAALADFYERHGDDPAKIEEHRALAGGATAPDPDATPAPKKPEKPEKPEK